MIINKKYYFINNFYTKVLNYSYLIFLNKNLKHFNSMDTLNIRSCNLKKLNINKKIFLNNNLKIYCLDLINTNLDNISSKDIDYISFQGFFINNKYKNKFINYSLLFKNNYKLFIFIIYININIIKYLLFYIMFKIIYILNFLETQHEIKKNLKKLN